MKVNRVVANIAGTDLDEIREFYMDLFGFDLLMDLGWIKTLGAATEMPIQISVASEGGSGTAVPDLSIEVDNLETALERVNQSGVEIVYGPVTEPWGVKRFYLRDPSGKLLNIVQHEPTAL